MKRRVLTIVLAIVLAVAGTGLVLVYVHQADNRALAGQRAVNVLVAQKLIPAGTPAGTAQSDGSLQSERLPASSVPANALGSLSGVSDLVASASIQPGQVLLRPMLVTAAQATSAGGIVLPSGTVAVTIGLCAPEAVAGYVHDGSIVSIYDTSSASAAAKGQGQFTADTNCNAAHVQQALDAKTKLVLANVPVLAVGQPSTTSTSSQSTSTTSSTFAQNSDPSGPSELLVTLAVSKPNALKLIQLTVAGLPYLALQN